MEANGFHGKFIPVNSVSMRAKKSTDKRAALLFKKGRPLQPAMKYESVKDYF